MTEWFERLGNELNAIETETGLSQSRGFIYWFIRAYHTTSKNETLKLITDKPSDKTVDAIYVDENDRRVCVYQSKYTIHGNESMFSSDDLRVFSVVRKYFTEGASESSVYKEANEAVKNRLSYALECIRDKGYRLEMFFISTHKDNPNALQEILEIEHGLPLYVFAFHRIKNLFLDWEEDAVPRIPEVNIKVAEKEIFSKESANTPKSFVVTLPSGSLVDLYVKYREKLFTRNVREFLEETKGEKGRANRAMKKTLKDEPDMFWFFNNGITIVCEKANYDFDEGYIRVTNPQIINGGQTTRMISKGKVRTAEVLARIIQVPEDEKGRNMVKDMIVANNTQSKVTWMDLRANHPYQVALQREMEKAGHFYQRRRNEYSRKLKDNGYYIKSCCPNMLIENEILSQIVVATKKSPSEAMEGMESIFEHKFDFIFENWRFVYDYILPYQIHEIFKKNCDLRNLRNYDGRFSEERAKTYKRAKWHAMNLFFDFGSIYRKSESWKKSVSIELRDSQSKAYDVIQDLSAKTLLICYDLFRKYNKEEMAAIDYFKRSNVLDDFKNKFPRSLKDKINSELNKIG